jgi:N-acyl-L-homoserine lactone synthetase
VTVIVDTPGLAAADELAGHLLAGGGSLRVEVAATSQERDAIFRLRHRVVVGNGWARAEDLSGGVERDHHDPSALHIAAWAGDSLVGAMRIVLPGPGRRLPVEEAFDIEIEPRGRVVEAGRLVIAPEHRRDPTHMAWGGLFGCAWMAMRARGFSVLCGAASPRMVERLRAVGLPFEVLGPARMHWGEARSPVRLDPAQSRPGWF